MDGEDDEGRCRALHFETINLGGGGEDVVIGRGWGRRGG